jgi:hypothetical protein
MHRKSNNLYKASVDNMKIGDHAKYSVILSLGNPDFPQ